MNISQGKNTSSSNITRFPCRDSTEVNGLIAVYSTLVCIIVASNIVIVITFVRNRKLRNATNMFFVSLAVSDILVGAVSIPMWIVNLAYPLHNNCTLPGPVFYHIYKFLDVFSALASTAHLMAISLERSLAISYPLWHRSCPRYIFRIMLAVAWLYGLVASVVIVVDFTPTWTNYRAIGVFIIGFILPLLVIMILYATTYRSVRQYVKRRRNNSMGNFRKYINKEKRTAKTVGIVLFAFIVAWLPFFIVSLVTQFCGPPCYHALLIDFVKILYYTNSAVNPYIYTFRNATWKRIFLNATLPCKIFKQKRNQWSSLTRVSREKNHKNRRLTPSDDMQQNTSRLVLRDIQK